MPTYIAFLRAVNVGKRRFAMEAVVRACEGAGFTDVETYLNTGNVRVTTGLRSRAKVEATLEEAFAAEAGFERHLSKPPTMEKIEEVLAGAAGRRPEPR